MLQEYEVSFQAQRKTSPMSIWHIGNPAEGDEVDVCACRGLAGLNGDEKWARQANKVSGGKWNVRHLLI